MPLLLMLMMAKLAEKKEEKTKRKNGKFYTILCRDMF